MEKIYIWIDVKTGQMEEFLPEFLRVEKRPGLGERWRPEAGKATQSPELLICAYGGWKGDGEKGRPAQKTRCEVSRRQTSVAKESNLKKSQKYKYYSESINCCNK